MTADAIVRARIDSGTKQRAAEALQAMGLSISDAIRLLMLRVAEEQRMPFDIRVPVMDKTEPLTGLAERNRRRLESGEDLFRDLKL